MSSNPLYALARDLIREHRDGPTEAECIESLTDRDVEAWVTYTAAEFGWDYVFTDISDEFSTEQGAIYIRFLLSPEGATHAGRMAQQALRRACGKALHRKCESEREWFGGHASLGDQINAAFRQHFGMDLDRRATAREHNATVKP